MKIKLVESALPYSKYRKEFEKKIVPVIDALGFKINLARTVDLNNYETRYYGTYTDDYGKEGPFTLAVNTTHQGIDDDSLGQLFLTLNFDGKLTPLGAIDIKDPLTIEDAFDTSIPDRKIKTFVTSNEGKIPARDNSVSMTKDEWQKELKQKQIDFEPRQFGNWFNTIYPLALSKEVPLRADPTKPY